MGGESPIRRVLRPNHCEEYRATHNLAERRKGRKSGRSRGGRCEGKRRRRVTFVLGHWKIETQSCSIVVSAWEWLVVNPFGVAEPTVGWKRTPLSAVAITPGVISDKCFISCILKFIC
jgi:hypothetical protein